MARLYLIRHPHTCPDPAVPASRWGLSERGEAEVWGLVALPIWARVAAVYTSREYKAAVVGQAVQSAHGVPWTQIEDLRESSRDAWIDAAAFEAAQRAYFAHSADPPAPDWESAQAATARFVAAVEALLKAHPPDDSLAVVAHATVLTLYAAHARGAPPAYDDWRAIGFAAVQVVDRAGLCPLTPFLSPPYDGLPRAR